ncbi:TlpA family protein disulfide reductase [Aquimarina agarilytica]|uniref:TlpA family protein disulfide reductase n=1 Tax=Aquimarina agarilytica TaxID=1087449 RepID=UPI000288465F|nr:TlpA disulfide reductase family protein [Aquimarina agarilytica]
MKTSILYLLLFISYFISFSQPNVEQLMKSEKVRSYIGKKLPSMNQFTLEGEIYNAAKSNGKPTLINFWFIHCKPCVDEMPYLNKLKEKYDGRMNFISMTFDNEINLREFLKTHKFNFTHVSTDTNYINEIGVRFFPKNVLLDKNGIVKVVTEGIPDFKDAHGNTLINLGIERFETYLNELFD